jgi:hypothetical protein
MFTCQPYREELLRRISTIRRMLDVADPQVAPANNADISREVRGLVILLLFASYENLLKSLCRGLLEQAASLRVGNRRLRTGFRQFAVHTLLVSISDSTEKKIWKDSGRKLLDCAFHSRQCTIDTNIFPIDGSFMKRSQVKLFFDIFELGEPGAILKEVWDRLDTIVIERNDIAHGKLTPEEVGRAYSSADVKRLVDSWERRWLEFIDHIESKASVRDFFRR